MRKGKRGCLKTGCGGLFVIACIAVIGFVAVDMLGGDDGTSASCVAVPDQVIGHIQDGLTNGATIESGQAIQHPDNAEVWYVAAMIHVPNAGEDAGVWGTNLMGIDGSYDGSGIIMSVDGMANEFSQFGDSSNTNWALSSTDDSSHDAVSCVENAS